MKLKFFTIPALAPEPAEAELNRFLGAHRIAHVERQWAANGTNSFWAVCVSWLDMDGVAPLDSARRSRVDYREVLAADEFAFRNRSHAPRGSAWSCRSSG